MGKTKQVILMRVDLGMRRGKQIAQGAHAAIAVILNMGRIVYANKSNVMTVPVDVVNGKYQKPEEFNYATYQLHIHDHEKDIYDWVTGSFTKICVGVGSEEELRALIKLAEEAGLPCSLMIDDGTTEFGGVATITAGCIGPADSDLIDPITGHLKLL